MTFAQDCNLCAGGTYLHLDGDRVKHHLRT